MRITLKLVASLTDYLPQAFDGSARDGNEQLMDFPAGTTVQQLIDRANTPAKLVHLVLVNGVFIPPAERMLTVMRWRFGRPWREVDA